MVENRVFLSNGITPFSKWCKKTSQMLLLPALQWKHLPHSACHAGITWSPGCTLVTPCPTLSTILQKKRPKKRAFPKSVNIATWIKKIQHKKKISCIVWILTTLWKIERYIYHNCYWEIFCTRSVAKIDHSSIVQIGGLPCAFMPQDSRENAVLVLTSSHSIKSSY